MHVDIKHRPAFASIFAQLGPDDVIIAEADAMASMDAHITIKTRFNGGLLTGLLKRIFGGESLFINEFRAEHDSGDLVLTQPTPGDIACLQLNGETMFLERGSFIACGPEIRLGIGWAGFASWFGGEGLFRLKVSGHGPVWFGGYGGIFEREVDGEYVVDTGHLLAYEPTVRLSVGMAGGLFSSWFSGEGLITRVRGSGRIWLQSRSMDGLAHWTNGHIY